MPELPEVETLRRNLERSLLGRRFAEVSITLPKLFVSDSGLGYDDLVGRQVLRLRRRAKYLILDLSGDRSLVVHLRMSGQLVHRAESGETLATGGHPVPTFDFPLPHRATHAIFTLDDGSRLYLTDIRQFGRLWLLPTDQVEALLERSGLGPEPLADDFTLRAFRSRLSRRPRAALKPLLLDQRFIVGVGNIYVDEIAFASKLSPLTPVGSLSPRRVAQLHRDIRAVLEDAVTNGVADIRNGKANPARDFPRVHGREGSPCPRCSTPIVKSRVAGRGTYTCPKCQRYPTPDARAT
jgi:formamidopyrimidine-DNA glycosylase